MNKKVLIIVIAVVVAGAGGFFMLGRGKGGEAAEKHKIEGHLHPMTPEFLLNLAHGRVGKFSVTLLLAHDDPAAEAAAAAAGGGGHGGGATEAVAHPQEPLLREIVVDTVTGADREVLLDREGRKRIAAKIKKQMNATTDAHVERVSITDLIVD